MCEAYQELITCKRTHASLLWPKQRLFRVLVEPFAHLI